MENSFFKKGGIPTELSMWECDYLAISHLATQIVTIKELNG